MVGGRSSLRRRTLEVLGPGGPDHDNCSMHPTDDPLEATERWFVHRGIPHFIEDYSASRDIFTRAAPPLTFIFLIEVLAAVNFHAWWANTLAIIGAFVLVLGVWGFVNRWRG